MKKYEETAWTPEKDAQLMRRVSEGDTFTQAGNALGISKGAAQGRFSRIAKSMGWQAS